MESGSTIPHTASVPPSRNTTPKRERGGVSGHEERGIERGVVYDDGSLYDSLEVETPHKHVRTVCTCVVLLLLSNLFDKRFLIF